MWSVREERGGRRTVEREEAWGEGRGEMSAWASEAGWGVRMRCAWE